MEKKRRSCMMIGDELTDYEQYRVVVEIIVNELIRNHDVNYFCTLYANSFERVAAEVVHKQRKYYPGLMNVLILPRNKREYSGLPDGFDACLYYPSRDARTDGELVRHAYRTGIANSDVLLSGVEHPVGLMKENLELAASLGKQIFEYTEIYKMLFKGSRSRWL